MAVCAQCGQANPAGARFCNSCGAQLDAGAQPGHGARKTVTVVFCDMADSTALGERFDPEVVRSVMSRFYEAARAPVARHGGTVEKVIGDALVAVFGIPAVREDDALRAVRAASEMQAAVLAMGDVQARIGVNTGEVLAGGATPGESLMAGDAVNVAARLQQAAAPGEVLVGAATWDLVGHAVRGDRVEPVVAKGKRHPLVAWRLDGVDATAGGHRRRLDLPMVGRDSELELLRWTLERTDRTRRPHLVTVLGAPGIGKSRLVSEVAGLRADLTVLTGHCRASAASSSLEPLLEVARAVVPDGDPSSGLAELMPGEPDALAVGACLAPGGAAGVSDIAWAVSRLIGTMSLSRTLAIVLEDVHWADDALLDVVEQLLGHSRLRFLLVVCTARPEFADRRPEWGARANSFSFTLERLDDDQTRRLLTHAGPALPAERAEHIVAVAEGNPLFAEHLAALLDDRTAPVGLPPSIQVLLTARLEALPEPEREVASVAAVAGRDFPLAAVEALVGRPIQADVERLEHRELFAPTAAGREQFTHALLQEAAYALIPKRRRADVHVRLARWLDADGASDAVVGDHLDRAFVLRAEVGTAGDDPDRLGEEAGTRLAAAGRRADAMGDPGRARVMLERALELLPETSPGRAAAMIELAAAGWNLFDGAEVRQLLDAGADLAATRGQRALELRARVLRLGAEPDRSTEWPTYSNPAGIAETDAALRELEMLGDPRALATALCAWAEIETNRGRAADAGASARRALDVLRASEDDTVWALSALVRAVIESPMPVSDCETLLAQLTDDLGARPTVRSELISGQAILELLRGNADQASRLIETGREIERDLGRWRAWLLLDDYGRMLARVGRFEDVPGVLRPVIAKMELLDARWEAATARSWLGLAEARMGNADAAVISAIVAPFDAFPAIEYEHLTRAQLMRAEACLATGDVTRAVARAHEAVGVAVGGDWLLLTAEARMTLARALNASGDVDGARAEAAKAAALYAAKGCVTAHPEALPGAGLAG